MLGLLVILFLDLLFSMLVVLTFPFPAIVYDMSLFSIASLAFVNFCLFDNYQLVLYQAQRLLHSEGNNQCSEQISDSPRYLSGKEFTHSIHQQLQCIDNQKTMNPIKTWTKGLYRPFSNYANKRKFAKHC